MSDTLKHAGGFLASITLNIAGITLQRVNEFGACACWIIGCIAGLCTIQSWLAKRRKARHLQESEDENA